MIFIMAWCTVNVQYSDEQNFSLQHKINELWRNNSVDIMLKMSV